MTQKLNVSKYVGFLSGGAMLFHVLIMNFTLIAIKLLALISSIDAIKYKFSSHLKFGLISTK